VQRLTQSTLVKISASDHQHPGELDGIRTRNFMRRKILGTGARATPRHYRDR
jgi:hypothetical protein